MLKVTFWLLDLSYTVNDNQPQIWLWGLDENNQRILVIDEGFLPYFYLVMREDEDPKAVVEKILSQKEALPLLQTLELVDRKFFGKPVKAIKVFCRDPRILPAYSKKLGKITGVEMCLEENIRYPMKYVADRDVTPCSWHEVEVETIENSWGIQVKAVYLTKTFPKAVERGDLPSLRILGFTAVAFSQQGTAKPERDRLILLSVATDTGDLVQFSTGDGDDRDLLVNFTRYVTSFDPDVIIGYESNQKWWPYLLSRGKIHKLHLTVGRRADSPHRGVFGHISIPGRANVDLYDFTDEIPVKIKMLGNLADYLDVIKQTDRTFIDETDVSASWEKVNSRPILLKFSLENLHSIMGIAKVLLTYAIELSRLVGIPLDHIGTVATGFRVEQFLMKETKRIGELVPDRIKRSYKPYEGGLVLKPSPGIYENVAVLDFKSMYPNIMIVNNISPDTYLRLYEPTPSEGVNVAPGVGHRFRKEPPGFYKAVLTHLIQTRDEVSARLRTLDPESIEYRLLDARQRAVKVLTNAVYGYAGWQGARWYRKPVAEATAAWGRHIIKRTIEMAKRAGLEVIYSDTDSLFVNYDPVRVEKLLKEVGADTGLELKPNKIYTRVLFTEAKKRYCGLLPDGHLDITGLEVIRGDWANAAKNVQKTVLGILLREKSPQKAAEFVRRYLSDLLKQEVPYRDLVIWKTLTKAVGEYKVRTAHVEVAKKLRREGRTISVGDKIGYVVTVGDKKLYERARPYSSTSYNEIDLDYYVQKQVLPTALRILKQFGITERDLLPSAFDPSPRDVDN